MMFKMVQASVYSKLGRSFGVNRKHLHWEGNRKSSLVTSTMIIEWIRWSYAFMLHSHDWDSNILQSYEHETFAFSKIPHNSAVWCELIFCTRWILQKWMMYNFQGATYCGVFDWLAALTSCWNILRSFWGSMPTKENSTTTHQSNSCTRRYDIYCSIKRLEIDQFQKTCTQPQKH